MLFFVTVICNDILFKSLFSFYGSMTAGVYSYILLLLPKATLTITETQMHSKCSGIKPLPL